MIGSGNHYEVTKTRMEGKKLIEDLDPNGAEQPWFYLDRPEVSYSKDERTRFLYSESILQNPSVRVLRVRFGEWSYISISSGSFHCGPSRDTDSLGLQKDR